MTGKTSMERQSQLEVMLRGFLTYARMVVGNWVLIVFFLVDMIAVVLGIFLPGLALPPSLYLLLIAVGIAIAGYQVARDLAPEEFADLGAVQVQFLEGSEYSWTLCETRNAADIMLPDANLEFDVRIRNGSQFPIEILSIEGGFLETVTEDLNRGLVDDQSRLKGFVTASVSISEVDGMGRTLDTRRTLIVTPTCHFAFSTHHKPAQFAARLSQTNAPGSHRPRFRLEVEFRNVKRDLVQVRVEQEVSLVPLRDLYLQEWEIQGFQPLVDLAQSNQHST